jgi:hypothetical protein
MPLRPRKTYHYASRPLAPPPFPARTFDQLTTLLATARRRQLEAQVQTALQLYFTRPHESR